MACSHFLARKVSVEVTENPVAAWLVLNPGCDPAAPACTVSSGMPVRAAQGIRGFGSGCVAWVTPTLVAPWLSVLIISSDLTGAWQQKLGLTLLEHGSKGCGLWKMAAGVERNCGVVSFCFVSAVS